MSTLAPGRRFRTMIRRKLAITAGAVLVGGVLAGGALAAAPAQASDLSDTVQFLGWDNPDAAQPALAHDIHNTDNGYQGWTATEGNGGATYFDTVMGGMYGASIAALPDGSTQSVALGDDGNLLQHPLRERILAGLGRPPGDRRRQVLLRPVRVDHRDARRLLAGLRQTTGQLRHHLREHPLYQRRLERVDLGAQPRPIGRRSRIRLGLLGPARTATGRALPAGTQSGAPTGGQGKKFKILISNGPWFHRAGLV